MCNIDYDGEEPLSNALILLFGSFIIVISFACAVAQYVVLGCRLGGSRFRGRQGLVSGRSSLGALDVGRVAVSSARSRLGLCYVSCRRKGA